MSEIKQFKANQKLSGRSVCDYNCIFEGSVIKRTVKTVTIIDPHGEVRRCKIHIYENREMIYPLGNYTMCPIFRA